MSYKKYKTLDGNVVQRISKISDGSIISLFDKIPIPKYNTDVVCPHFLELKWANGCKFDCAWCFLQGTYRFHPEYKNGNPNIKNYKTIEHHLRKFVKENESQHELLNSGELADSLLAENTIYPFSKFIVDVLDRYDIEKRFKVLFLTKSIQVHNIIEIKRPDRIIMSFSLNADAVAKRWEKAPTIDNRIKAAKKVFDAGYQTRIRIDPMVPIDEWKKEYLSLIDKIFDNLRPERITIGSLRGLQATINNSKDASWVQYLSERSNWGRKIDTDRRYQMYYTLIDYLKNNYHYTNIALCKETVNLWERLKLDYKNMKCNCLY